MEAIRIDDVVKAVDGVLLQEGKEGKAVTCVSINSREVEEGALFVPIKGERYDAHDFIASALQNGAFATLTERAVDYQEGKAYVLVKDAQKALQALASYYRSRFEIPVIGVTGSVGKTSTKEMLAAALGRRKKVCKTKGNLNGQIGAALMMFELNGEHELAVIEMGVSKRDEMEALAAMVRPEAAVVTNIGASHIGNFGSKASTREEKCHIIDYFPQTGGTLFVCGDDARLEELAHPDSGKEGVVSLARRTRERLSAAKVVTYGEGEGCLYRAQDVTHQEGKTFFTLKVADKAERVELNVLGKHHVYNALAAFAVADRYGVPRQDVKDALRDYEPGQMRGSVVKLGGARLIDDTYNASPDSIKSGLEVLFATPCEGKRLAVLADVLELGAESEECHREVGRYLVKRHGEGAKLDVLLTVGSQAGYIAEEVEKADKGICVRKCRNKEEAADYLQEELRNGDLALLKGSRGMHMEEIIEYLSRMGDEGCLQT